MRNSARMFVLLGIAGALGALLYAAGFWEERDYREWSEKQCLKLLRESPWAGEHVVTRISRVSPMAGPRDLPSRSTFGNGEFGRSLGTSGDLGAGSIVDREVRNTYRVVFASAEPIRLATERLLMLRGTEPGPAVSTAPFDEAGFVRVEISYSSTPPGHNSLVDVDSFFRRATAETLRNQTYLAANDLEIKVPLAVYQPPVEGRPSAVLFFPRRDESGNPYFDGTEKFILFHTELNIQGAADSNPPELAWRYRTGTYGQDERDGRGDVIDLKFKTGKMKFKGNFTL